MFVSAVTAAALPQRPDCQYASVPEMARKRLGMSPGQQNLLIRVTLRSLDGSISKEDANRVYDLVYSELHEGTAGYFRARQGS